MNMTRSVLRTSLLSSLRLAKLIGVRWFHIPVKSNVAGSSPVMAAKSASLANSNAKSPPPLHP